MSSSRVWFRRDIVPGTLITLDQPVPSQWEIVKKLNEYDHQLGEKQRSYQGFGYSFASTKLLCRDPYDHSKTAFMRIFLQVPYLNTESDDADTRARQATALTPLELTAYQELLQKNSSNTPKLLGYKTTAQDRSGLVPGGFAIWLAWEIVPGLRLGDKHGPDPFWALESRERDKIRVSFMMTLPTVMKNGYLPNVPALSSLVWHKESGTLYFIGFRNGNAGQPKGTINLFEWIALYGLAIPSSDEWLDEDWNEDTSGWRF